MNNRRVFLKQASVIMGFFVQCDAQADGRRAKPKPKPQPSTSASSVVRASKASGGTMHKHFQQPHAYIKARVATKESRLLFSAVSKGASPSGSVFSKGSPERSQLERAFRIHHQRKGVPSNQVKQLTAQSMASVNTAAKNLRKYRARQQRMSNVTLSARSFDRLANQIMNNKAHRTIMQEAKKKSEKHPKFTTPLPITHKNLGYVYVEKPGTRGKTYPANQGTMHVGFSRKGVPFVHKVKLYEQR